MPTGLPLKCRHSIQTRNQLRSVFLPAKPALRTVPAFIRTPRQPRLSPNTLRTPLRRRFHISALRPSAVIQNPVYNEQGQELALSISERAAKRLSQISQADLSEKGPQVLRINVEAGGCHGFQYLMKLERESEVKPARKPPENEAASEPAPSLDGDDVQDTVITSDTHPDAKIVLDTPSLELLAGSTVDYTKELIGAQFKIVGNPRASSSCGCGTSFDIVE